MPLAGWQFVPPWILGDPVALDVGVDVVASPGILGISEHLRVRLLLGIVRVDAEAAPQVCYQCRFRQEGTHVTGQVWVLGSLYPGGEGQLLQV